MKIKDLDGAKSDDIEVWEGEGFSLRDIPNFIQDETSEAIHGLCEVFDVRYYLSDEFKKTIEKEFIDMIKLVRKEFRVKEETYTPKPKTVKIITGMWED